MIAGQGTAGLEMMEQAEAMGAMPDIVLVGASGGGLISGVSIAVKEKSPATVIYSVEPAGFDDLARSLKGGARERNARLSGSICDALLAATPGELTFEVARRNLAGGLSVTDEEAKAAVRYAFEELKLVLEPGGAVSLAAILAGKLPFRARPSRPCCRAATSTPRCSPRSSRSSAKLPELRMSAHDAERERRGFAVRVSLLFAAVCVVVGTNLPTCRSGSTGRGSGAREIAIVTSAPLFVRVAATPVIAFAADRAGDHRRFLIALAWAVLAALLVLSQVARLLADPRVHAGLRHRLDHHHAADRDGGHGRRQGRRPRLRPHAAVGLAQLHRRELLRRLGGGAAGRRRPPSG